MPDRVLLLTVSGPPWLKMPPPLKPELPDRVQLLTVSVLKFKTPPPPWTPVVEPFLMVRLVRAACTPLSTWKTRLAWLPSTVTPAVLPSMAIVAGVALCPLSSSWPLLRVTAMKSAAECLARAMELEQTASEAHSKLTREVLLEVAGQWRKLAVLAQPVQALAGAITKQPDE